MARLGEEGRGVVVLAQEEARRLKHNYVGTEHLLLGLLREGQGSARTILRQMGLSAQSVRSSVKRIIGEGTEPAAGAARFTPRAKKVLELSVRAEGDEGRVQSHRILLALLEEGEGVAAEILNERGVTLEGIREALPK
jgi:ATP-dependent Clp protease ATP-binding subunit ClpC